MKNHQLLIKTVLVTALVLTSYFAKPYTAPVLKKTSAETQKTIRQFFQFPGMLLPIHEHQADNKKVEVLFTTDSTGCVNFVLAKTNDDLLKKQIEKKLSGLRLIELQHDVVHSVTLNLKTL